jgi:hypothetical protein
MDPTLFRLKVHLYFVTKTESATLCKLMADNEYDDNGSSSDESGDNDEKSPLQLQTKLTLRVHAANLPRYGIRKLLPDTYIDVTAIYPPGDGPGSSSTSSTPTPAAALRRIHCGRTEM